MQTSRRSLLVPFQLDKPNHAGERARPVPAGPHGRSSAEIVGTALAHGALFVIMAYRNILSSNMLHVCRFFPSCSAYAQEAIERHGAFRGAACAMRRILRCHPFSPGGVDPVL